MTNHKDDYGSPAKHLTDKERELLNKLVADGDDGLHSGLRALIQERVRRLQARAAARSQNKAPPSSAFIDILTRRPR